MPGVFVSTNVLSGPSNGLAEPSGQLFLVGQFERGDTTKAVKIKGLSELSRNFGSRTTFSAAYDQLVTFFSEGGGQAYVTRVVGTSPVVGTLSLNDRNDTPDTTLRVDATSAGAWSGNLTVEVRDAAAPNGYRIIVRLAGEVVEDFTNLFTPDDAVSRFSNSAYIRVTNLGSETTAPDNIPDVIAPTALSAGSDDRATIVAANYVSALNRFTPELGDGAVAIPGQSTDPVWSALITHAKANNRVALLAAPKGETSNNLQSAAATLNSEFAGLFAPWVVIPDGSNGTLTISPEGYVAAVRARAHNLVGPWRTPAGAAAISNFVLDVDQNFTADVANDLDQAKVSIIRKFGSSVRLYGWRSLSNDSNNWFFLKDRDLLNYITVRAQAALEKYVFETIDANGHLFSAINAEVVGLVDPIAQAGGLFAIYDDDGNQKDPGYIVNTSNDINTLATLSQNTANVDLAVRISPSAALINLTVFKVNLLAAV